MRKRMILLAVFAAIVVIALTPSVALANFSIHGGYEMDTDACAGCHRAHTAASSITWTRSDGLSEGSALLISTASEIYEFCYTCHDAVSLGADTNVEEGIYEGTLYGTQFAQLNGGGFEATLYPAQHMYTGATWEIYGGATVPDILGNLKDGPQIEMSCSTCHDVHGSSNYRLLKDVVNGRSVGGYDGAASGYTPNDPKPTPWVVSTEPGYPSGGWLLHAPGAAQVAGYIPDYTEPMYAKAPDLALPAGPDTDKGMSGWCASCHIQYMQRSGAVLDTDPGLGETLVADALLGYDSNDGFGAVTRHRHPVNVELSVFKGVRPLIIGTNPLPLAHGAGDASTQDSTDWMECLTCHVAHGSNTTMTGYANVADTTDPLPDSGTGGVMPTGSNALLRMDNRAVCESCHNK
ncbi:MAG: cytochrome c3 family protein [Actinomycetota bacterium]|nr:cytochrome c3 family protein [Actinomycetota bacterium]